ncbi:ATP-binding cassette domain-containing protein [Streptomyces sp. NPDC057908]|uniref:ATP-binding cassette domain-containing protein n=1 Tax=Streptomyces sp. NPDC057908 TaxID=3346276 RepID=UPI0036EA1879
MELARNETAPILALKDVSKPFGAIRALQDVPQPLYPGEVHALAGESGAGKSTLIKARAGVHRPDSGQALLGGRPVVFHGPSDAHDAGIAVIHQEPTLFPDLSIAENIFMTDFFEQPEAADEAMVPPAEVFHLA